jgi:hypothetical protein
MLRTAAVTVPSLTRADAESRAAKLRSAVTNNPRSRFDVNKPEGRRARDLFEAYMARLGNPTGADVVANIIKAAELKARAETVRKDSDIDQIVRLENMVERAERKLGLPKPGQPDAGAKQPSPAEYLARRAAERAGKPSGEPA